MKFKVVYLVNNAGGNDPDGMTSCSFFTKAQALLSAQQWAAAYGAHVAWYWDGEIWRIYT